MFLIGSFAKGKGSKIKKAIGDLWFGLFGPTDIVGPTVLIRTITVNPRTAYFLDRKRKSMFIL